MLSGKKKKRLNSVATNKGLLNQPGENNCFLNSAIQVLWHLDVFRRSFRQLSGHACMGASCIFCALKDIFEQFQYSKDHALPPNVLRSALAESFQQQNRFQLGLMDDAAECFENILNRIHVHIGNPTHEDVCTARYCIPHQKFGLSLVEHCVCPCGATSEPLPFIEMVHYVSATALCVENEAMSYRYGTTSITSQMFGKLIRVAGSYGGLRQCPSNCGESVEMRQVLMNCPDVVSIGIVWDSEEPDVKQIINLVNALGTTLRLTELFHTVVDDRAKHLELYLVGMVCYYGKHYSTFFFHTKLRKWVYFDDAQVSEVGKRWSNVITKCIKGHHQPLLLLYANPDASPVPADTAPTTITMLPGYSDQHSSQKPFTEMAETDLLANEVEELSVGDDVHSSLDSTQAYYTFTYSGSNDQKRHESRDTFHKIDHTLNDPKHHDIHESRDTQRVMEHSSKNVKRDDSRDHRHTIENFNDTSHSVPRHMIDHPVPKNSSKSQRSNTACDGGEKSRDKPSRRREKSSGIKTSDVIISDVTWDEKKDRQRKPDFRWNVAKEPVQHSHTDVGQYVEPQPANWTTYKPYASHTVKTAPTTRPVHAKHKKHKSQGTSLSVKAVDNKGMATFRVTSEPHDHLPESENEPTRAPRPSAHTPPVKYVSIGRTSPGTSRRSSHSSHSSSSSVSKSSNRSNQSVARSHHSSGISTGSHTTPPPALCDEGSLHAPSYCRQHDIDLTPLLIPAVSSKPTLPPKPPFLSRPLSDANTNCVITASVAVPSMSDGTDTACDEADVDTNLPLTSLNLTATRKPSSPLLRVNCRLTERCKALFHEANHLMEKSRAADSLMDYSRALQFCLEATQAIEKILMTENLPEEFMVKARIRHVDFVNKSRILHRRKNLREKSQGIRRERTKPADVDGHVRRSTNQLLKPTKYPSNGSEVVEKIRSNPPSPAVARREVPGRLSPTKDEELIENLERNDSTENLIDFDKSGVTKFQHVVQNMFKRHNNVTLEKKAHHEMMSSHKSNMNNNNNSRSLRGDAEGRTKIFVWNSPEKNRANNPRLDQNNDLRTTTNKNLEIADNQNQSDSNVEPVATSLQNPDNKSRNSFRKSVLSAPEEKLLEAADVQSLEQSDADPPHAFRSITPTPQSNPSASLSRTRRARTPTPATNKELLRARQLLGPRRDSDLKLRPKSAYGFPVNQAPDSVGLKPSLPIKPTPIVAPPPPVPAWTSPPLMNHGSSPRVMPKEYYELFDKWLRYYDALSPEQRKILLTYPPNKSPALSPFSNYSKLPASPAAPTAVLDNSVSQLRKNLTNSTNSVGKETPYVNNINIYEANKPKPVHKPHSSSALATNNGGSKSTTFVPTVRSSSNLSRKPSAETKPNSVLPQRQLLDQSNDCRSITSTLPSNSLTCSNNQTMATSPAKTSQGMMKWAEEGKKRLPETTPETRNKLLQEFANRNRDKIASSARKSHPTATVHPSPASNVFTNSFPSKLQAKNDKVEDRKCALCGLVDVATVGEYCNSCQAYLTRLKPIASSMRRGGNT